MIQKVCILSFAYILKYSINCVNPKPCYLLVIKGAEPNATECLGHLERTARTRPCFIAPNIQATCFTSIKLLAACFSRTSPLLKFETEDKLFWTISAFSHYFLVLRWVLKPVWKRSWEWKLFQTTTGSFMLVNQN